MKKLIFVSLIALFFTGCTTLINNVPKARMSVDINLDKTQYEIVSNISGEATVQRFLIFPIGVEQKAGYLYGDSYYSGRPLLWGCLAQVAKQMAVFNAVQSSPDVDYMIMPKYDVVNENYVIYEKTTVKVTGVGIKIK